MSRRGKNPRGPNGTFAHAGLNGHSGPSYPAAPPLLSMSAGHSPRPVVPPIVDASPAAAQAAQPPSPGPQAPAPAPAPVPQPTFAQPPQPPPGPAPFPHVQQHDAASSNAWRSRLEERDQRNFGGMRPVPQGEQMLPQVWLHTLRVRHVPAQACTIYMRSTLDPPYEFYIGGDEVCGQFPDRELYEAVEKRRQRSTTHEQFVGRITSVDLESGFPYDLGFGHMNLAPKRPEAGAPPWDTRGAPPVGWHPGAPGYPPPQGYGAPPYGPPPGYPPYPPYGMPYPYGPPPWAQYAPAPPPAPLPPPAAQTDPLVMQLWQQQSNAAQQYQTALLNALTKAGQAPAPAQPQLSPDEQEDRALARIERYASLMDKFRGPAPEPGAPTVTVTTLQDGTPIVATKDGIDRDLTIGMAVKGGLKDMASTIGDAIAKGKMRQAAPNANGVVSGAGRSPRPV